MKRTSSVLFILILAYFIYPQSESNQLDETFQVIQKELKNSSSIEKISKSKPSPKARPVEVSLEEIIKTDDYCTFQKLEWSDRNKYLEAHELFFNQSEFRVEYEDYQKAIRGEAGATSFTKLYQALALSGLLAQTKIVPYPLDLKKARFLFHEVAEEDPGNAAPLIYELAASRDLPTRNLNSLIERISAADRFDSYHLDYLRHLYKADGTGAIAFVAKIVFSSALAVPDWGQINSNIKKRFASRPDLIEKVGWLMVSGGLQAKNSWRDLEWDVLEYSIGRSMIKNRDEIPNYLELEKKITGRDTFLIDFKLFEGIAESCTEEKVEAIREHAARLRHEGKGLAAF